MLNVYDGTLSITVDKGKLETALNKVVATATYPLNYEVEDGDVYKVMIITGRTNEEKEVPFFNHPFIFKDLRGTDRIAVDMRPYMKSKLDDGFINVKDAVTNHYGYKLQISRLIFNRLMLEDNVGFLIGLDVNVSEIFANTIRTVIYKLLLDNSLSTAGKIASMIHYYSMDEDKMDITDLLLKLPKRFMISLKKLMNTYYDKMVKAYDNGELILPSKLVSDLIENTNAINPNEFRGKGLNTDLLITNMGNLILNTLGAEMNVAFIEHKPTMLSAIYLAVSESINKKFLLRTIIDKNSLYTKPKDVEKMLDQVIKENITLL